MKPTMCELRACAGEDVLTGKFRVFAVATVFAEVADFDAFTQTNKGLSYGLTDSCR